MDNMQEQAWRAFSASGDPLEYLEFSRRRENSNRGATERQFNENHKSKRLGD
ncbi:MAG: hypothetical protein FWF78_09030 [Defluviitaleaceae bacterium]|nr:hypothetical protein [Defluviitaleaceae bacterium]